MFEVPPHAFTFDDCLLLPGESEILPSECDLTTYLTPGIRLTIPLI
ncbi:MAG: IMP dehydrogenase, partial [Deltaproteobacteria bacterium]|nr:IMP dehydrogenase [Deltaproteobacteria bacterium]